MKPRKLLVTIEMLTDIASRNFTKIGIEELFAKYFVIAGEVLKVHQVRTQVVKEKK